MGKKIVAKKSWSKRKYLAMGAFAKSVGTGLTGNADFTTPAPPIAPGALTIAGQLVIDLYSNRLNGPTNKTNFKAAIKDCDDKLHLNVDYISEQAGGSALKIESTNCVASTNSYTHAVRLGTTPTPALKALGGNRMKSTVKKMLGATSYVHIFYTDKDSIITVDVDAISCMSAVGGSFSFCNGGVSREMGGFTANKKIYCCTVAKNAAGYGNLSASTSSGVLGN
ncbi:MAG: hypothetical protein WCL14_02980 [Bacteroidota bacterium]